MGCHKRGGPYGSGGGIYRSRRRIRYPDRRQRREPKRRPEAAGFDREGLYPGRPEILILDDSSSALDYKTDAAFRKELEERYGAATTIIIAQRVSSILHCDQILVLEDGVCQGLGTHEELLKSCGVYREISEIQMGGDPE